MNRAAEQHRPLFWLSSATLVAAIVFGGGTRAGYFGDTVVQIIAIPTLLLAVALTWREREAHGWILGWAAALLLLFALHLVPLPQTIWMRLPLSGMTTSVYEQIGKAAAWRPLSVSPHDTWIALLSFLPPAAVFFAVLHLNDNQKTQLLKIVLGLVVISCAMGLWQVAALSGYATQAEKPLSTDPTGFFRNRNHFSALLYCSLLIAAALMIDRWRDAIPRGKLTRSASAFAMPAMSLMLIIMSLALIVLSRSRAGMVIAIAALIGAILIAKLPDPRKLRQGALRWFILASALIFIVVSQYAFSRILLRFGEDPLQDGRATIVETAWPVAWSLMPFGSGFGTFVPVYKAFEQPSAALMGVYVNRAHNEFLELWMEAGIPGLVILGFALVWLVRRIFDLVVSSPEQWQPGGRQLSAAAAILVILLLAHSAVDYPLRTTSLACIFALSCGILARPIGRGVASSEMPAVEVSRPEVGSQDAEAEVAKFRPFQIAAAVVPDNWAPPNKPEPGKPPATEKAAGRTLVSVDKADWHRGEQQSRQTGPEVGGFEGWPDVWRKRTTRPSED